MPRFPWSRLLPLLVSLGLVACTRTCVGIPELGSKKAPLRFFVAGATRVDATTFDSVVRCVEEKSGFRLQFESTVDEKGVGAALGRGEAHFGYLSSLGYVAAADRFDVSSLLVRVERGLPSTRALIIGKTLLWQKHLADVGLSLSSSSLGAEAALSFIDKGRFLFVSPEDDLGFFVPRFMLLERNVFPAEAAFAGSFNLVLQGLERELGVAGVVSEPFLLEKYNEEGPLRPGMTVGPFVVIDVSRTMPGRVVAARNGLSRKIRDAVANGLTECSKGADAASLHTVFGGEGFASVSERAFASARELYEQQETYLRVLAPLE